MNLVAKIGLGIGLALWTWLVWHVGPWLLLHYLQRVGWGILALLAVGALRNGFRAVAFRWALGEDRACISFLGAYRILMISEAVKFVAAAGVVFGESAKGTLLAKRVSTVRAVSSVVIDVVFYQLSAALFLLCGAVLMACFGSGLTLPRRLSWIVGIGVASLLAAVILGYAREWRTTRRLVVKVVQFGHSVGSFGKWFSKHEQKIAETGDQVADFHRRHSRYLYGILLLDMAAHLASVFEVMLALRLLGEPTSYLGAVAIEALTKIVRLGGTVIPANIGVFEGGTALVARTTGYTAAAGMALGMVRQLQSLLWAGTGFFALLAWPEKTRSLHV